MADWDARGLQLADLVRTWSKDPSTQVGAAILRPDGTVASLGYNGFPRGVEDSDERLEDRAFKYPMTVHAEANAILSAKEPVRGYTLCVSPLHPCANCAALAIQAGVRRIVTRPGGPDRWADSFQIAKTMFCEAGVDVVEWSDVTPEQRERRRQYNRAYWRTNTTKRKREARARWREQDEWCRAVLGSSYDKVKAVRAALRAQAAETGEDFLDLARQHNVLMRRERARVSGIGEDEACTFHSS
jgi:dCMP deaminase